MVEESPSQVVVKVLDRSIEFDQLSPPTVTGTHSALETFTQDPILLHDLIVALGLSRQRTVLMFRKPPSPTDDGLIDTQGKHQEPGPGLGVREEGQIRRDRKHEIVLTFEVAEGSGIGGA